MLPVPDVCNRVLGLGECVDVDGGKGKLLNVKLRTLGQQTLDISSNITYLISEAYIISRYMLMS